MQHSIKNVYDSTKNYFNCNNFTAPVFRHFLSHDHRDYISEFNNLA